MVLFTNHEKLENNNDYLFCASSKQTTSITNGFGMEITILLSDYHGDS